MPDSTVLSAPAAVGAAALALGGLALVFAAAQVRRARGRWLAAEDDAASTRAALQAFEAEHSRLAAENRQLREALARETRDREHEVRHDPLTSLLNRVGVDPVLDDLFARAETTRGVALLVIGLNQFRDINTTLGPAFGDRVLPAIGDRLRASLPPEAVIARLGGDEFAVAVPGIDEPEAAAALGREVARVLRAVMSIWPPGVALSAVVGRTAHESFIELSIDAAIGIALAPRHGSDRAGLMRRAYVAMAHAKRHGPSVQVYDETQEQWTARQLSLAADLRRAISDRELSVVYQPKAALPSGRITGAEALVRWNHPVHGLLAPSEFLPLAAHTGIVTELNDVVVAAALADLARWRDAGLDLELAVNLTVGSLRAPGFADQIGALLDRYDLVPQRLTLEITEGEFLAASEQAGGAIDELRRLGVRLSIDDFGTGYSSLAYLSRLPVDKVKIDRMFVADIATNDFHAGVVGAVVDLCRRRGSLTVVAEGVEDRAGWAQLAALGCDAAQGYGISRPLDAEQFVAWVTDHPRVGMPEVIDLRGAEVTRRSGG